MKKNSITVLFIIMLLLLFTACDMAGSMDGEEKVPLASGSAEESDSENADGADETTRYSVEVLRVIDGDTIEIDYDGKKESLRMIGIDTPESVHPDQTKNIPYGKISSDFTKEKLEGKTVDIEFDTSHRDQYGRLLAYVYLDGELYNKLILEEGHALVSTFPPNVRYVDVFTEAQSNARSAGKGLWGIASEPAEGDVAGDSVEVDHGDYMGNKNSLKFHLTSCQWAQRISERNAIYFNTRDDAIDSGHIPCKVCNP